MKRILIFGGTGFIGNSLAAHLARAGYKPILLGRSKPQKCKYEYLDWDAVNTGPWVLALEGCKAIVNLAGKSVDCRKTPDNCDLILRSRVDATKAIGKALAEVKNPPKVWLQMSTAHIYGDPPRQMCTEESSFGYGLAPFVARTWEKAFAEALPESMRGVRLRTSFVIGKNGGALSSLKRLARIGLGGTVGKGTQGMSWIHEYDLNQLILKCIENEQYRGVYIASAPNPVSNKEFMRSLRRKIQIPLGLPAPEFLTRFGARWILNTDPELALYGRYVRSQRLEEEGFTFKYPRLQEALNDLL